MTMKSDSSLRFSGRSIPWTGVVVAVLLACTSPTDTCGCSPAPLVALAVGEVTDPTRTAVAGATIRAELATPGCATTQANLGTGVSDTAGQYRVDLALYSSGSLGDCLHVWAEPPTGVAWLRSVAVPFSIVFSPPPAIDSVVINLTLRSPDVEDDT